MWDLVIEYKTDKTKTLSSLYRDFRNLFPENIAQATIATYRTRLVYDQNDTKVIKGEYLHW